MSNAATQDNIKTINDYNTQISRFLEGLLKPIMSVQINGGVGRNSYILLDIECNLAFGMKTGRFLHDSETLVVLAIVKFVAGQMHNANIALKKEDYINAQNFMQKVITRIKDGEKSCCDNQLKSILYKYSKMNHVDARAKKYNTMEDKKLSLAQAKTVTETLSEMRILVTKYNTFVNNGGKGGHMKFAKSMMLCELTLTVDFYKIFCRKEHVEAYAKLWKKSNTNSNHVVIHDLPNYELVARHKVEEKLQNELMGKKHSKTSSLELKPEPETVNAFCLRAGASEDVSRFLQQNYTSVKALINVDPKDISSLAQIDLDTAYMIVDNPPTII